MMTAMFKYFLIFVLLIPTFVYANYHFNENDLVGKWQCTSTATVKNLSNSWVYSTSVIEASKDGTYHGVTVGEMGFANFLIRAFLSDGFGVWHLKDDKLYSKATHINNHIIYDNTKEQPDKKVNHSEPAFIKTIIEDSAVNYQYPAIFIATDKDNYTLTLTMPLKDDMIVENISPTVCRRMIDD